ncbi:MAG: thiamine pyrophosphate-dependent enzyme [Xanthomonadales bacterium]|nr:thiamine pyrophosphate-dependent enzyme [Xanthomonadales bacterium]
MSAEPKIHIPHPTARPGEEPDFSYLNLSDAGAMERPPTDADFKDMEHLAHGLIRVLDDEFAPQGPWAPELDRDQLLESLKLLTLVRAYDDRMYRMQRQGKISFYMQCLGEEATSIGPGMALRDGDMIFPHYRQQALYLMRGTGLLNMMCHCLSNTRDFCRGRQMPVFYQHADGNMFTISGNLCTQYPQAVGWAMAAAIKGTDDIAASWIGDGSTAEADFHHALTFAAVYQAPVILNVVNNQWAISTFQAFAGGERTPFAARGHGYGIPALRVDGNDLLATYATTAWAAERARNGGGPTLIEFVTYRGGAHSTSDDPSRYRPKDEWSAFPLGDPLKRLVGHLETLGHWSRDQQADLEAEMKQHVTDTWKEACSFGTMSEPPFLDPGEMFEDVFEEMPPHLEEQQQEMLDLEKN